MAGAAVTARPKPFVGRDRDLAELRSALRAAVSGHGSLVLVAGEPGIGKTRLAERLASDAAPLGAATLWGNACEGSGAPPFWPWIQLMRQLLRQLPAEGEQLDMRLLESDPETAELARMLPELARVLPELAGRVPDGLADLAVLPPDQARFRLFDAVATLLARASAAQPLLLVLDDLHLADRPSLRLLRFLAQELWGVRILLLGAYRDVGAGATGAIDELAGVLSGAGSRLVLRGLGVEEVAELVAMTTGTAPTAEQAASVLERTGGNPLFVREVARLLAAGMAGPAVPDGVRPVLARRLDQLRSETAELLAMASVLGTELRPDLLAALAGISGEAAVELLGEAADARLVELVADPPVRWRFAHALVREVLYERLPLARRLVLHRRAGEVIEAYFAADLTPHLDELAGHFLQTGPAGAAKALDYAERAGRHALELLAWEDAAGHFRCALDALDLVPEPAPGPAVLTRRLELELGLAGARMAIGETVDARAGYERAAALARRLGDAGQLARAAIGLGAEEIIFAVDELQVGLLEEALSQLKSDSALRARLLARLAKALEYGPDIDRRIALASQALAIARRVADPATLAAVLVDHHRATWGGSSLTDQLAIATEILQLAEAAGDRLLALQGRLYRSLDLLELGEIAAMRAEVEAFDRGARASRQMRLQWLSCQLRGSLALIDGRLEEARRLNEETLGIAQRAGDPYGVMSYLGLGGVSSAVRGNFTGLVEPLRQAARPTPAFMLQAAVVVALLNTGQRAEAREEFERLAAGDFATLVPAASYVMNAAVASLCAYGLGDAPRASILYRRLEPYAGQVIRGSRLAGGCFWAVSHHLGLLAITTGHWDDAVAHLEAAVRLETEMGALPYLASTRYHLAEALTGRGHPGDAPAAAAELHRARALLDQFGIRPVLTSPGTTLIPAPDPAATPTPGMASMSREGEYWTVIWHDRPFRLRDTIGLGYLARLLAVPGRELRALDLATSSAGAGTEPANGAERARVNVTKALRGAIRRIAQHDPDLGDHLRRRVRTGASCSYQPDPAGSVTWTLTHRP